MNTDNYNIYCETRADRNIALATFLSLGVKWHGEDKLKTPKEIEGRWSHSSYPYLHVRKMGRGSWKMAGNSSYPVHTFSLKEVYAAIEKDLNAKEPVTVALNEEYSATISEDGIRVGCQSFTFQAIKRLCQEIRKFQED